MSIGGDQIERHIVTAVIDEAGLHCLADLGLDVDQPYAVSLSKLEALDWADFGAGFHAVALTRENGLVIRAAERCDGFLLYAAVLAAGLPEELSRHTPILHDLVITKDGGLFCLMEEFVPLQADETDHLVVEAVAENLTASDEEFRRAMAEDYADVEDDIPAHLEVFREICRRIEALGLGDCALDIAPANCATSPMGFLALLDPVKGHPSPAQIANLVAMIRASGVFPAMPPVPTCSMADDRSGTPAP